MAEEKESLKKKVDETWKEAIAKKKKVEVPIEMDFSLFISTLGMQALMHFGEITNPLTKKKEEDLDQAKQTIDILQMLKVKTKGNLTEDESKVLDNLLYELQMKYVDKVKGHNQSEV